MAFKKMAKSKKTKLPGTAMNNAPVRKALTNAELRQRLAEALHRESAIASENVRLSSELQDSHQLTEALEQQTATSEILGVIASLPNDLAPVLDTVAQNAVRLCEAKSAQVFRIDGDLLHLAANYGELPSGETRPISRGTVSGRAIIECRTIHADDPLRTAAAFPESTSASGETRLATRSPTLVVSDPNLPAAQLYRHARRLPPQQIQQKTV